MNELSLMVSAFRGIIYYFFRNLWNRMKGEKMKKEKDSLDRLAGELDCSRREAFLMVRNAWMRSTIGGNPAKSEESKTIDN